MLKHCIRLLPILLLAGIQPLSGQVTNTNTGLTYSTIQAAIDAAATLNGHTLVVAAGTYAEDILIHKSLTINGPKMGIDGNDVSRGTGEATIYPATANIGDGNFNGGKIINITADNVTLDGLTIDGANPTLPGFGIIANGADFDVDFGIASHGGWAGDDPDLAGDNIVIRNNIVQNVFRCAVVMWGAYLSPDAHFGQIKHNRIQNVPYSNGSSIFLIMNYYASIEYNTFIDVYRAVLCYWNWLAKPPGSNPTIKNNTITTKTQVWEAVESYPDVIGIVYHFFYANADPYHISDNTMTNTTAGSAGSTGIAIYIDATADPVHVYNNNITGFENGYRLSTSTSSTVPTTISGGTLTNNTYGVSLSNFNFNGNYPASPSLFNVNGVTIQNSTSAGVLVDDNVTSLSHASVAANINNCKITGGPVGILLNGDPCSATAYENDLSANINFAINNLSVNTVNAGCNWYGHWTGPIHVSNIGGLGTTVSNNVLFTPWLINGTDNNLSMPGFQPVPGSCIPIKCGNNNNKYILCHNGKTICIDYAGALDHLAHGDILGECTAAPFRNTTIPITGADKLLSGKNVPETFRMVNSPNPFINSTTIKYELPFDSKVSVRIFNAMGQEVASLINSEKKAGAYSQVFDASRLGSGIFYYKLIAITDGKRFILSGKMVKQ